MDRGAAGLEFVNNSLVVLIDPYHSRLGKFEVFFRHVGLC